MEREEVVILFRVARVWPEQGGQFAAGRRNRAMHREQEHQGERERLLGGRFARADGISLHRERTVA